MNDAQKHVQAAVNLLDAALTRLSEAQACVAAQGLKDFDARSVAIAKTNIETGYLWALRGLE